MKHQLTVLVFGFASLLPSRVAQASDALAPGARVRITTADAVKGPDAPRAGRKGVLGEGSKTDDHTSEAVESRFNAARIMLAKPGRTFVGEVVAIVDGALVMKLDRGDRHVRVPLGSIATTEVSSGKTGRRHGRGALRGFGIGAAFGATLGFLSGDDTCTPSARPPSYFSLGDCFLTFSAGDKAIGAGIVGGAFGTVVGAIAGAGRTDRWNSIALADTPKVRVSVKPLGLTGVSFRLGF